MYSSIDAFYEALEDSDALDELVELPRRSGGDRLLIGWPAII